MQKIKVDTPFRRRNTPTLVGVFDSYRDLLEYNNHRQPLASPYTASLVDRFSTKDRVDSEIKINGKKWFGTKNADEVLADIWDFINRDNLNAQLGNFQSNTVDATTVGFNQRKKLYLNDLGRGVFSFDLAAAYLYQKVEYYSPLFKQVVNEQAVTTQGCEPDLKYFYSRDPVHEVEQKKVFDADGNPVLTSSFDRAKCYIDIPKPKREKIAVDLFVSTNFSSGVGADELVWNALAVNAVAQTLQNSNIEFRVWGITAVEAENNHNVSLITSVKNYNEALDTNAVSIICADPRIYRIHSFKARSYLCDDFGQPEVMSPYMGVSILDTSYKKKLMLDAFRGLDMYDDPVNKVIYEENKIFVRRCLSQDEAIDEYKRIMQYFEMYSLWQQIGLGVDIGKFDIWYRAYRNTQSFDEWLAKNP